MVAKGKSRFYKRKDDKFLIYLKTTIATDSMFPFPLEKDSDVNVKIKFNSKKQLIIEKAE